MRKLLLPGLLLMALFVACENKNPSGPGSVGPGGVTVTETTSSTTTTSTIPISTTTSTTSTTTTVTGNLARRYVAFQAPPNVPADMTLFFQLLTGGTTLTSVLERFSILGSGPAAITENEYKVTGVYVMGNGISGGVDGELGEALNPLETGGVFEGTLTANMPGCTAEREFGGQLGPQTLQWGGGSTLRECPGSPLGFQSFTLLRSDAPLPTTTVPPTTTTSPTTSTSSTTTTTTAVACTYTLSPTSASAPAAGSTGQIVIGTLPTCAWTAQSFASWLTVAPASGAGPASVTYTAAPNPSGPARTGTLVIAGATFTVTQAATSDLTPILTGQFCGFNSSEQATVTVQASNIGLGTAASSVARILFISIKQTADQATAAVGAGSQTSVTFVMPNSCFTAGSGACPFTITLDATGVVFESDEANNSVSDRCGTVITLR